MSGGAEIDANGRVTTNDAFRTEIEGYQNRRGRLDKSEKKAYRRLMRRRDFIENYGEFNTSTATTGAQDTLESDYLPNFFGRRREKAGIGTSIDRMLGRARGGGQAGDADFMPDAITNRGTRRHGFRESFDTGAVDDQGNPVMTGMQSFNSRDNLMGGGAIGRFARGIGMHGLADFGLLPTLGGAANAAYTGLTYEGDEGGGSTFGGRGQAMLDSFQSGFGKTFGLIAAGKGLQMGGRAALAAGGNTRLFDAMGGFLGAPSFYESIERGAKATMGGANAPAFGSIPQRINNQVRAQSVSANLGFLEEEGRFIGGSAQRQAALTARAADPSLTAAQNQSAVRDLAQHNERVQRTMNSLDRNYNAAGNEAERIIYGEMDEYGVLS